VLPAADAQQRRLGAQRLNELVSVPQIIDGFGNKGPRYRTAVLAGTTHTALLPRIGQMLLDADDLKDRNQLPLLVGELGLKAMFQMRKQNCLYAMPNLCYFHRAFAPWPVLFGRTTKIPPRGEWHLQSDF
jgi:hypothetical protein